jgi:hypothetical protein
LCTVDAAAVQNVQLDRIEPDIVLKVLSNENYHL